MATDQSACEDLATLYITHMASSLTAHAQSLERQARARERTGGPTTV